MRLLIVGGGAAGFAAARAYREAGGEGDVEILTPELGLPYRRPPLTKEFLRGELEDERLPIEGAAWYEANRIVVRSGSEAQTLDPRARTILLGSGETLRYDACVLATGAEPSILEVPGATEEWVHLLRSLATARVLQYRAETAKSAIVIGSDFIGYEAAASLAMRGLQVTLISDEPAPHATRFGEEAGRRIQAWLEELGVQTVLGAAVEGIGENEVHVPGRDAIAAELILMAGGVHPRAGLAATAGIEVRDGRILTDEHTRTSAEGVYAAGDVALAFNVAAGRHVAVTGWNEAVNTGAVAGRTIAGAEARWDAAPAGWSVIGEHTVKYAVWGDGFDEQRIVDHGAGAWTIWYGRDGRTVGVLAHESDEDFEAGRTRIAAGAPLPD